jgi:hypothetical protein
MSAAATSPAPVPMLQEGLAYWEELVTECKRQMNAINAAAMNHGLSSEDLIEWIPGRHLGMIRRETPSTEIKLNLSFENWGPVISGAIKGRQQEDLRFYPEELEVPLGQDDDGMVAIFEEGKSLSPREFAVYLGQRFRRCFPEIALPCPE